MAFCSNCGSEVSEGTKFCPNCGAAESDGFGKLFGIILLIISLVDFITDPPIVTIILSIAIIVGCIFCLYKKYQLKGFTIVALILAVFCLLAGIFQAKKEGLFGPSDQDTKASEDTIVMESTEEETEQEEIVVAEDSEPKEVQSSDGVNPELKAFLDSYEEFINDYIDFMKKYSENPDNVLGMITEYSEFLSKYQDFAEKIDAYDANEMSAEDAKYYLEVVNRCSQKMLEVIY